MKLLATIFLMLVIAPVYADQKALPIIDMHVHASRIADFEQLVGKAPIPHCVPMTDYPIPDSGSKWQGIFRARNNECNAIWSPATDEELMAKTLEIIKRRNIIAVASGPNVERWKGIAPERIIPSVSFDEGSTDATAVDTLRKSFEQKRFFVLGEVGLQYAGLPPDDPSAEPYWAMAEKLNVPVGIHIGTGPVGAPYVGPFPRYRARLHSALLLEEVLIKHPDLRVYIMHAGWPMLDDLLAVLWTHPHVYVDVGAICWALPRQEFHRYVQRIVESGFGKRVMFGSDNMVWPDTIDLAIESIESAKFLTPEQKRDIFFNNAARFLKLSQQQIDAMHAIK
jgi:predicted TIM-barrel fold metal-dependent hydrolase